MFAFEEITKWDGEIFDSLENDFFRVVGRVVIDDQDFPRVRNLKLAHGVERLGELLSAVVGGDNDRKLHDSEFSETLAHGKPNPT